ncbi:hypothetical protein NP233_g11320 [Leucocoprinus birnbaumii]|uniref:F-box domain-containing protein n=1 Tax=Leucocoprinus birnbaumii TaxID=56174 RepID=A0AAD5YP28_9AGAR|nr:hypothetical protein NP233_g11320 [Leucocoprinus birnbaumii]
MPGPGNNKKKRKNQNKTKNKLAAQSNVRPPTPPPSIPSPSPPSTEIPTPPPPQTTSPNKKRNPITSLLELASQSYSPQLHNYSSQYSPKHEALLLEKPFIYDPGNGPRVRDTKAFLSSNFFAQPPAWDIPLCAEFAQDEVLEMIRTVLSEELALMLWYNKSRASSRICPACQRLYRLGDTLPEHMSNDSKPLTTEPLPPNPRQIREQEISGLCSPVCFILAAFNYPGAIQSAWGRMGDEMDEESWQLLNGPGDGTTHSDLSQGLGMLVKMTRLHDLGLAQLCFSDDEEDRWSSENGEEAFECAASGERKVVVEAGVTLNHSGRASCIVAVQWLGSFHSRTHPSIPYAALANPLMSSSSPESEATLVRQQIAQMEYEMGEGLRQFHKDRSSLLARLNALQSRTGPLLPEILSYIFILASNDSRETYPGQKLVHSFGGVCRQWRNIVLSTPILWSSLILSFGHRSKVTRERYDLVVLLQSHLERVQMAPLSLTVIFPTRSTTSDVPIPSRLFGETLSRLSTLLFQKENIHKVHTLRLVHPPFDWILSFPSLPNLTYLGIYEEETSPNRPQSPVPVALRSARPKTLPPALPLLKSPRLYRLEVRGLKGLQNYYDKSRLAWLTHISLSRAPIDLCITLLSQCVNLVQFEFSDPLLASYEDVEMERPSSRRSSLTNSGLGASPTRKANSSGAGGIGVGVRAVVSGKRSYYPSTATTFRLVSSSSSSLRGIDWQRQHDPNVLQTASIS